MSDLPKRIVCIDDEPQIRELVRDALERLDEEIVLVTCGSGQELISRFQELQPDLVLLDAVMPNMNGPDTVEALREQAHGAEVPIIFLTGKIKLVMTDSYKSLGIIGVIHKPFDPLEFPEMIRDLWQKHADTEIDADMDTDSSVASG